MNDTHTVVIQEFNKSWKEWKDKGDGLADDKTCPAGVLFTVRGNQSEWIN